MVEDYVKDLYWIGFIALVAPLLAAVLSGIGLAILGQPLDQSYSAGIGAGAVSLTGILIMLYVSIKYYYREGRRGKT